MFIDLLIVRRNNETFQSVDLHNFEMKGNHIHGVIAYGIVDSGADILITSLGMWQP